MLHYYLFSLIIIRLYTPKVFFYSSVIFKDAGISDEYIQYAILSTGVVNVLTTIVCVPLIDKLGRKPLLIYPMVFMIIDFVCLILLLTFKVHFNKS